MWAGERVGGTVIGIRDMCVFVCVYACGPACVNVRAYIRVQAFSRMYVCIPCAPKIVIVGVRVGWIEGQSTLKIVGVSNLLPPTYPGRLNQVRLQRGTTQQN